MCSYISSDKTCTSIERVEQFLVKLYKLINTSNTYKSNMIEHSRTFQRSYQEPGMFSNNISYLLEQFSVTNRSRRIGGRAENEQPWLLIKFRGEILWFQKEIIWYVCRNNNWSCISQPSNLRIANPEWCWNYNLYEVDERIQVL